jgi:translation initiation factor 2 beta subunit (eIF-2beta)/eIF-5
LHLWTDENGSRIELCELEYSHTRNTQNIYITEHNYELNEGWYFNNAPAINFAVFVNSEVIKGLKEIYGDKPSHLEKITLTTNTKLIADDVQAIDDTFLEWFVKNPSCEKVEVKLIHDEDWSDIYGAFEIDYYKIIIPKEEPYIEKGLDYMIDLEEPKQDIQFANGFIPASFFDKQDEDEDTRDYWQNQYKVLLNNHKDLLLAAEGAMQFLQEQGTFGSALFTAINEAKKIQNEKRIT